MLIEPSSLPNQLGVLPSDRSFLVESRLALRLEGEALSYDVVPVHPPYTKSYPPSESLSPDSAIGFTAREGERVLGQIYASTHWNGCAAIEDLVVSSAERRRGVGMALVEAAKAWALANGRSVVRAETQSNNVSACLLYAKAGFRLSGFDNSLYCMSPELDHEVALFWYWRHTGG